jgi:SAM-dependent methyltransferase
LLGLSGTFLQANAEQLGFPDQCFDLVYSHGVLHHTPNTRTAIDEVYRVLKPGGRAIVMLYHRHSFNYYARIMTAMRLRVLFAVLRRAGRWRADRQRMRGLPLAGVRGNAGRRVWEIHYQNFLKEGWRYLKAKNFLHHCTDGPECPIAFAFNRTEARELFSRFRDVQTKVAHFPLNKYPLGDWLPFSAERFLASRIGWYLFIFAWK